MFFFFLHQGFLSQLHGSLVSNLQLGVNNGGFGLGNFCVVFYRLISVTHTDILSYCMNLYMGLHVYYGTDRYLHTIFDGHHSWIMMRGTTSMHLQWRLLSDQQEDDHTCAHGEKFHAWLRMLKPSGIWQAITWLPGQNSVWNVPSISRILPPFAPHILNFPGLCGWVQLVFVYHLWGRGGL